MEIFSNFLRIFLRYKFSETQLSSRNYWQVYRHIITNYPESQINILSACTAVSKLFLDNFDDDDKVVVSFDRKV